MVKIYLAADHGGLGLKEILKVYLDEHDVVDLGTHSAEPVNYPDYAGKMADTLLQDPDALGILVCGTGLGMTMVANRHKHIRAARCTTGLDAQLARQHNNANVLCLGGRIVGIDLAKHIVDAFLSSSFEGGRHQIRIAQFSC